MDLFAIEELPFDIRGEIFEYIDLSEMIRCEQISFLWRRSMPYFIYREFDTKLIWGNQNHIRIGEFCHCLHIFAQVLMRIKFDLRSIRLTFNDLCLISRNSLFTKIKSIISSTNCTKLKTFSISMPPAWRFDLNKLLTISMSAKLRVLRCNFGRRYFSRVAFLNILENLEELDLDELNMGSSALFPIVGHRLKVIKMSNFLTFNDVYNDDVLRLSARCCPRIESIIFESFNEQMMTSFCQQFVYFYTHLKSLQLSLVTRKINQFINWTEILLELCQKCTELDRLSLDGGIGYVNNQSIIPFYQLRLLKSLKIDINFTMSALYQQPGFYDCVTQLKQLDIGVDGTFFLSKIVQSMRKMESLKCVGHQIHFDLNCNPNLRLDCLQELYLEFSFYFLEQDISNLFATCRYLKRLTLHRKVTALNKHDRQQQQTSLPFLMSEFQALKTVFQRPELKLEKMVLYNFTVTDTALMEALLARRQLLLVGKSLANLPLLHFSLNSFVKTCFPMTNDAAAAAAAASTSNHTSTAVKSLKKNLSKNNFIVFARNQCYVALEFN